MFFEQTDTYVCENKNTAFRVNSIEQTGNRYIYLVEVSVSISSPPLGAWKMNSSDFKNMEKDKNQFLTADRYTEDKQVLTKYKKHDKHNSTISYINRLKTFPTQYSTV